MKQKVYKGLIKEDDYGENCSAIFIGEYERPISKIFEEDFVDKSVTVRHWISDTKKTKQELLEHQIKKIAGSVDAEYFDSYSEVTGYLYTTETLNIGGHNLMDILWDNEGKFIRLEVDVHN